MFASARSLQNAKGKDIECGIDTNRLTTLTGRIKQSQGVRFPADHHRDGIIVEDRWNIRLRKRVGRVGDEHGSFAHTAVAHADTFDRFTGKMTGRWRSRCAGRFGFLWHDLK